MEVLSGFYGNPTADAERFAVLDRAHELGCTFWDTADGYGDSEELIGEWFRRTDKRNEARGPHLHSQSFDQISDPEEWLNLNARFFLPRNSAFKHSLTARLL